jgi:hypothetical protein
MRNTRTNKILIGKPKVEISIGRWEESLKIYLKEIRCDGENLFKRKRLWRVFGRYRFQISVATPNISSGVFVVFFSPFRKIPE